MSRELPPLPRNTPLIGSRWMHCRGSGPYTVTGHVWSTDTDEWAVLYQDPKGRTFTRTVRMWNAPIAEPLPEALTDFPVAHFVRRFIPVEEP